MVLARALSCLMLKRDFLWEPQFTGRVGALAEPCSKSNAGALKESLEHVDEPSQSNSQNPRSPPMSSPKRSKFSILPKSKLQRRFVFVFLLSAMVPLALMTGVTTAVIYGDVQESVNREMQKTAQEKQRRLEDHLATIGHNAQAMAELDPVVHFLEAENPSEQLHALAQNMLESYQEEHWGMIHHVMLATPQGEVVLSPAHGDAEHAHEGQNLAGLHYFSKALQAPLYTDFFGFEETDHYHQLHMQPVRSAGKTIGVLVYEIEIGYIAGILEENNGFESAHVSLVTLDGVEVVRGKDDLKPPFRSATFDLAASAPGIYGGQFKGLDGEEKLGVFVRDSEHPWVLSMAVNKSEAEASATRVAKVGLLMGALGSVVVILLALRQARSYSKPLAKLAETATAISGGDLTLDVEVDGYGEIRDVQEALAQMVGTWGNTISQVLARAEQLNASSSDLEGTSKLLQSGVATTMEQTAAMSAASEEMSVTMSQVAESSSSVSKHVEQSMQTVSEMSNGMEELLQRAETASDVARRIAEVAQGNDERIQELGHAAEEVGKVIDLIEDIADQTNLLALNATIEAARAGEAGNGFAVVATEVKDLAAQSSQASREIRTEIEGIRKSTETAVIAVRGITDIIGEVSDVAEQIDETVRAQTQSAEEVLRHMSESNRLATTLSRNVAESSVASQEIARGTSHVASTAEDTAKAAELASSASQGLSAMAGELSSMAAKFKA